MDQLALRLELAEALAMHDLSREHYVDYWNQCHHRAQDSKCSSHAGSGKIDSDKLEFFSTGTVLHVLLPGGKA